MVPERNAGNFDTGNSLNPEASLPTNGKTALASRDAGSHILGMETAPARLPLL